MGRRLGQHFLTDPGVLDRIADALEPAPRDVVVEIGPGQGTLTRRLASRVGRLVAIEKDPELAEALQRRSDALPPNVDVVAADALDVSWAELAGGEYKTVGNIPYYITSPLLDKAVTPPMARVVVFLIQREVADRLVAEPGTKAYGALTVGVRAAAGVERLFTVRAGAFRPPPQVDSAVVRLRPRPDPLVAEDERSPFRRFVVALFGQRRKQLLPVLARLTDLPRERVADVLAAVNVDPAARCEVVAPDVLAALYRALPGAGRTRSDVEGDS